MSFHLVWSGSAIAPSTSLIVWGETEHLMVVQTSFHKGAILAI